MANTKLNTIWTEFSETTGFHGFNKISRSSGSSKFRIFVWLCIILACASYLTYLVVIELQTFYRYPTTMTMFSQPMSSMEFPSVTICNINSLNKSAMEKDPRIDQYYFSIGPMGAYNNSLNWSDPFYKESGFYEPQVKEEYIKEHKTMLGNFLFMATFDHQLLDITDNFDVSFLPDGPCITSKRNATWLTQFSGSLFNLVLWLNIESTEDYYGTFFGQGIKIIVHEQNEDPVFMMNGQYVGPGREVFASIRKQKYEYLPAPYKAMDEQYCKNNIDTDTNYSQSECIRNCYEQYIYNICHCHHYTNKEDVFCSKYNISECIPGAVGAFLRVDNKLCLSSCQMPCTFNRYDVTMSSMDFPSEFYSKLAFDFGFQNKEMNFYRKNYIYVHMYFDRLETTVARQVPVYASAGDIFANLGGQMGLFMGASIITLTELGEFILFFLLNCVKKRSRIKDSLEKESTKH